MLIIAANQAALTLALLGNNGMQLHQLKPTHKTKTRKRVGRGGKRGTYSGKGMKGQTSRAGARVRPALRDLIKTIPKLRGVKFKANAKPIQIVNLLMLEEKFESDDIVSPEQLLKKRLIRRIKGKVPRVKLLGIGELTKKLTVRGCKVSKSVKEKVEKAGGQIQ